MSQDNVALVAKGWEHFHATGRPLDAILAPNFVWDMSTYRGWPEQPLYHGADGMRQFLDDWSGAFDDWTIDLETLHDAGEKVVSVCHQTEAFAASGVDA
jgi:hypothetical protein